MRSSLQEYLKQLRLSGLAQSLEVRLSEAAGNRLDHAEFLELILQDELAVRGSRQIERRVRAASFRETKNLDEFDFSFNPSIKRRQIEELATCRFIREKSDLLLLGPPGVGKSFLVQAIGYQAIKAGMLVLYRSIFDLARDFLSEEDTPVQQDKMLARYLKPELLIIDDMGMKQLPRRSGEYLLEIIMRRHENRSTMMTSNRPLEDWAKLIGDVPAATAILDRFLQHATIIQITGKSYRLRNAARSDAKDEATAKAKGAGRKDSEARPSAASEDVSPPPEKPSDEA
jgi:DNA replication protein DnaC